MHTSHAAPGVMNTVVEAHASSLTAESSSSRVARLLMHAKVVERVGALLPTREASKALGAPGGVSIRPREPQPCVPSVLRRDD